MPINAGLIGAHFDSTGHTTITLADQQIAGGGGIGHLPRFAQQVAHQVDLMDVVVDKGPIGVIGGTVHVGSRGIPREFWFRLGVPDVLVEAVGNPVASRHQNTNIGEFAEFTGRLELGDFGFGEHGGGVRAFVVTHHHPSIVGGDGSDDALGLVDRSGNGFFGEDRFAMCQQFGNEGAMARKWLDGNDGIELLVGEQLGVGRIVCRYAPFGGDQLGMTGFDVGDGDDFAIGDHHIVAQMGGLAHVANPHKANADFFTHTNLVVS